MSFSFSFSNNFITWHIDPVIALFPNSPFELIVGFYMWAPLKVKLLAGDLRVAMIRIAVSPGSWKRIGLGYLKIEQLSQHNAQPTFPNSGLSC